VQIGRRSLAGGIRPRYACVLVYLVLYQPQVFFDHATLVRGDGDTVDVTVGDGQVVDDGVCRQGAGHAARATRVARISDRRT